MGRSLLLAPLARAADTPELLDGPTAPRELARCLGDVARLNALFGGRWLTLAHVRRVLRRVPPGRPVTVLDLGTGSADIPRALVRWARRTERPLRVLALDHDRPTLHVAGGTLDAYPEIELVAGDALALPFATGSVDIAMSALTLHHLEPAEAVRHLAEMDRVARVAVIVNDLVRSRLGYALVWLSTRVLGCSAMARHDGPLSVRRAYTPAELQALGARAGLAGARVRRYAPLLRQCLTLCKT